MKYRAIEKITKSIANHRRIEILNLLSQRPNMSVVDISYQTRANLKTIDVHVNKLFSTGLVTKKTAGKSVLHSITKQGNVILSFLRKLE